LPRRIRSAALHALASLRAADCRSPC
jgi:hypothetical protein